MKKHFPVFALVLAVLALGAVSCKKDGQNKFSPKSIEDFNGTVWTSDGDHTVLSFLDWGTRIYNNIGGKITLQYRTLNEKVSFTDGAIWIDGGTNEFNDAALPGKLMGKLVGQSLHFFICDSEWTPASDEADVLHLKRNFDLSSLKFANSFVPHGVDLGELSTQSGVKTHVVWAEWNLGAKAEKEVGLFYAWGEIEPKPICSPDNHLYKDNPDELPAERDAVSVRFGSFWRMPSRDEFSALLNTRDDDNFSWTWEEGNVPGWRITRTAATPSYLQGNSIFLPCAGYVGEDGHAGYYGWYWTSTSHYAASLGSSEEVEDIGVEIEYPYYGQCIRPVYDPL